MLCVVIWLSHDSNSDARQLGYEQGLASFGAPLWFPAFLQSVEFWWQAVTRLDMMTQPAHATELL